MSDQVRAAQEELYGAPLSEVLGHCGRVLRLNQAELARALGISAPMLSQLINAHRVKIANPVAAVRLQAMSEAVDAVEQGRLGVAEAKASVAAVRGGGGLLTSRRTVQPSETDHGLHAVMRQVAPAEEYLAAAQLLADAHPRIAGLLRVIGSGTPDEVAAYVERG